MERKIIQIATALVPETDKSLYEKMTVALCNDGTVWEYEYRFETNQYEWMRLKDIPQDNQGS